MKLPSISILLFVVFFYTCQSQKTGDYVCEPCDLPCDSLSFDKPGKCPHCGMILLHKSAVLKEANLELNEIDLVTGSGVFLVEGRKGREENIIKIYYHKPESFSKESNVLLVIPGAGRNGDSYRDAWIETAEKYGTLILSPMYSKSEYPFEDYHLGGLIKEPNLREVVEFIEKTNITKLNEADFTFEITENFGELIFGDFDRLFEMVKKSENLPQTQYDIFGHSAGGQILHRLAIFHPNSKANRIIAANSGFYTLPDLNTKLPFGIQNSFLKSEDLKQSFNSNLTLLIGELDNENETGGTLLRSESADRQGLHRLERGHYFYKKSKETANKIGSDFNWKIEIVHGVGHNHRAMGQTAAKLLYGE